MPQQQMGPESDAGPPPLGDACFLFLERISISILLLSSCSTPLHTLCIPAPGREFAYMLPARRVYMEDSMIPIPPSDPPYLSLTPCRTDKVISIRSSPTTPTLIALQPMKTLSMFQALVSSPNYRHGTRIEGINRLRGQ